MQRSDGGCAREEMIQRLSEEMSDGSGRMKVVTVVCNGALGMQESLLQDQIREQQRKDEEAKERRESALKEQVGSWVWGLGYRV